MHPTIERLRDAMNRHDPAGMAATMAPDYRSDQPAHPNRAFTGNDQVVANWTAMFAGMPDLEVEVVADATDGSTVFSEWRWRGSHPGGAPFAMAGVIVAALRPDGLIQWNRLYMEEVEQAGEDITDTVRALTSPPGPPRG
jgi:predicted SnoaL-like aldol condensation-catalyzing enzyme